MAYSRAIFFVTATSSEPSPFASEPDTCQLMVAWRAGTKKDPSRRRWILGIEAPKCKYARVYGKYHILHRNANMRGYTVSTVYCIEMIRPFVRLEFSPSRL